MSGRGPSHLRQVVPPEKGGDDEAPRWRNIQWPERLGAADLRRRLLHDDPRFRDRLLRGLLLVFVSALAALLLGPHLVSVDLPTEEAFVGTAARSRVVADRDYEVVDGEETEARRRYVAAASRAVWDLDLKAARASAEKVGQELVRLADALSVEAEGGAHGEGAATERKGPESVRPLALKPSPTEGAAAMTGEASLVELRSRLSGEVSLLGLEAPHDDVWTALTSALKDNPDLVARMVARIEEGVVQSVVRDASRFDEPGIARGIIVRPIGAQPGEEWVIDDTAGVLDEDDARAALREGLSSLLSAPPVAVDAVAADAVSTWLAGLVRTTLTYNAAETDLRRRQAVEETPPVVVRVRRGETVLAPGELIRPSHLLTLSAMRHQQGERMRSRAAIGTGAFVLLLCLAVYRFGARGVFHRRIAPRDLTFLSAMLVLFLLSILAAEALILPLHESFPDVPRIALFFAIPIAWAAMQIRIVLDAESAFLFTVVAALLGGIATEPGVMWTVVAFLSSMTAIAGTRRIHSRWALFAAGLATGLMAAGAAVTLELFRGTLVGFELLWVAAACLGAGLASGVLVVVLTPLVEMTFGYVSDLRLLSLSDLNQPLLKELIVRAPGTWHHSMRVARLAEAGAEAIGANPLLARVMSLYHDVGKVKAPDAFSENRRRDDAGDVDEPEELVRRAREHVSHGLELAATHRIPHRVSAVIEEHHGDNLMLAAWERARANVAHEGGEDLEESAFRYGGHYPTSRESALVLLADQIESAVRHLDGPDSERIAATVDHFVNLALVEGYLAGCDLSLRDLELVRSTFHEGVLGFFNLSSLPTEA